MQNDIASALIHHPYTAPAGFESPQTGVYKASTVLFADVAAMRTRDWRHKTNYTYGLHGTPTTFVLEERIATLEGGKDCCLVPSGLAAIALVDQALLAPGDEILLPSNVYGPSRELARNELARWGITHRLYDPMDAAAFAAMLNERTRLVWLEAAGSVTMEFPDLKGLVAAAKARGVLTAIDNTWGAGLAFNAFDLGIDISTHALTKFPSGGGDVLMGAVTTRDPALHERIKLTHMRTGVGVGANDAELVLRSLGSMPLRYRAHDQSARALATWLQGRPEVLRVLHPALAGSPGHEHWKAICIDAAGLFSVMFKPSYSTQQVDRFVDSLQLFGIGFSWAGPMSLVVPYDLAAMRGESTLGGHLKGHLVRFSIGLEETEALRADMEQALRLAFAQG
jgi:cysteine-S-conjugate beta-lyase